jgi:flavin reductase (DIM6/NTAB) family NADH-FMN oxidoreductase RutF
MAVQPASSRQPEPVLPARDLFRHTLGMFPTGVTVVAVREKRTGEIHGMTANAFMSVSLEPPLVVVSVRDRAHLHRRLAAAGSYGVSFLAESQEQEARRFAGMPVLTQEQPPEFELRQGAPVLRDAMAWVTAEVVDAHLAGDHTLFIGRVLEFGTDIADRSPLCFFRGRFGHVTPWSGDAAPLLEPWSHSDNWG